jgi:hypothetical protein
MVSLQHSFVPDKKKTPHSFIEDLREYTLKECSAYYLNEQRLKSSAHM